MLAAWTKALGARSVCKVLDSQEMMDAETSCDEIEGIGTIRACSLSHVLIHACRSGGRETISSILNSHSRDASILSEHSLVLALLEAVAWSRVDAVKMLLDAGASITERGNVWTPGGSGVSYADTSAVNAVELCRLMDGAGLRPRRARIIRQLIGLRELGEKDTPSDQAYGFRNTTLLRRRYLEPSSPEVDRVAKRKRSMTRKVSLNEDASETASEPDTTRSPTPPSHYNAEPPAPMPSPNLTSIAHLTLPEDDFDRLPPSPCHSEGLGALVAAAAAAEPAPCAASTSSSAPYQGMANEDHSAGSAVAASSQASSAQATVPAPVPVPVPVLLSAMVPTPSSVPEPDVRSLEASVLELKRILAKQARELSEQRELLQTLYAAGTAAATVLVRRRCEQM